MARIKILLPLLALGSCLTASAVETQSEPELGKWCDDIDACETYADLHMVPLLAVWGNDGCGHCVQLTNALDTAEFREWAASRKILMCIGMGKYDKKALAVKSFCEKPNTLNYYPFVCVYWPKSNGKVVRQNFSGLIQYMPVDEKTKAVSTRAGCLIASVEKYIKGYEYFDPESGPVSFSAVGKDTLLAANGYLFAKRSETVALLANDEGVNRLDGVLTVGLTAKNKITAKYAGASVAKALSFTGTWATIDLRNGEVACTLTKNDNELKLTMSKEGVVSALLTPLTPFFGETASGVSSGTPDGTSDGIYTVLLGCGKTSHLQGEPVLVGGTGYATLTLKGAKATVKGVLPDGTTLSGNYAALADGDGVVVPIFKRTNKMVFGSDIAATSGQSGSTVSSAANTVSYVGELDGEDLTDLTVRGCTAAVKMKPFELLDSYGYGESCTFSADLSALTDSDYGQPTALAPVALEAGLSKFAIVEKGTPLASFTYKSADASFGGKLNITFGDSKRVSATVKGVFVPALADGTGVIGAGTAYFKDKVGGVSVTRSVPVFVKGAKAE